MEDKSKSSDKILLKKFKGGDNHAFDLLVHRYEKPLIGYLYGISSNLELSKDVCQETFIKLIKSPPAFLFGDRLNSWLFRTAKNLLIDKMRRESKSQVLDEPDNDKDLNPYASLVVEENKQELLEVVRSLDDNYREIVTLHFLSELTFREISGLLNIPIGTAIWRMGRALSIMKDIYEQRR